MDTPAFYFGPPAGGADEPYLAALGLLGHRTQLARSACRVMFPVYTDGERGLQASILPPPGERQVAVVGVPLDRLKQELGLTRTTDEDRRGYRALALVNAELQRGLRANQPPFTTNPPT